MSTTATATKPSSTPSTPATPPTQSPTDLATAKIANRLSELCGSGKGTDAIKELYADNARHIEAMEMPGCPRTTEGKTALLEKAEKFHKTTEIHSMSCSKPWVNGDQFTCNMSMDCTSNEGPMAGHRMQISETALYTVKNGKISEAKFFYGGCGADSK